MAAPPLGVVIVVVSVVLSTPVAGSAAVDVDLQGGRHRPCCFHACFDQCVLREEFWFCQFSCYYRCGAAAGTGSRPAVRARPGREARDCEHSCALSMCGQLRPGSKMTAACRDTCRKTYAVAACVQE